MADGLFERLAIAYAQAMLMKKLNDTAPGAEGYDEEIESFLKSYLYALERMPDLWPDTDA